MPALACCVDAAVAPPGYAFAGDSSLPAPVPFAGDPLATNDAAALPTGEHSHWSPSLSADLYRIDGWGAPYFSVNTSGNISSLHSGRLSGLASKLLDLVINLSQKLSVHPVIGVRAKLRTKHAGHFGSTSGEKGKFGLTTIQILRVVRKLEQAGMLDSLQLLHFHIGSQIPSTDLLADGVSEAAQIYCELVRLGAHMRVIDIGGGLGIDYDGSKSSESDISVGYGLEEYAMAVVRAVQHVCDRKSVKHPVICSESGRALVSHHSILIFEAVSASVHDSPATSLSLQRFVEGLSEEARVDYQNLAAAAVSIEQLADVDGLCDLVSKEVGATDPVRTYHVNLSVFTCIPDFWGIGQLFPIVPIHRLDQRPGARGILSDLTCDSDGKIDKFIGGDTTWGCSWAGLTRRRSVVCTICLVARVFMSLSSCSRRLSTALRNNYNRAADSAAGDDDHWSYCFA
ncbi:unnamed protein product, partial [Vitis vinifera]